MLRPKLSHLEVYLRGRRALQALTKKRHRPAQSNMKCSGVTCWVCAVIIKLNIVITLATPNAHLPPGVLVALAHASPSTSYSPVCPGFPSLKKIFRMENGTKNRHSYARKGYWLLYHIL